MKVSRNPGGVSPVQAAIRLLKLLLKGRNAAVH